MAGLYNRESLFARNIVDNVPELDLSSLDLPSLSNEEEYQWTVVKSTETCRPDLIAFRIYGNPDLWWIIIWINGISDPWNDLRPRVALKYLPIEKIDDAIKAAKVKKSRRTIR